MDNNFINLHLQDILEILQNLKTKYDHQNEANEILVENTYNRIKHHVELIAEYMGSKPNQSRIEYINQVINLADKAINESQLKYLLRVIQIELDQLN